VSFEGIGGTSTKFVALLNRLLKPLPFPKKYKFYVKASSRKIIDYLEFKAYSFSGRLPESMTFENCEGLEDFHFSLPYKSHKKGISAFIRAKNEEDKIHACLLSLIDTFDEIVFADNQSDDATVEIVQKFKSSFDPDNKVKVVSYPFSISRCGSEHKETPENSVHSISYFYNYTISHCTCQYVVKWDADMVLAPKQAAAFRQFSKEINALKGTNTWDVYGQTLYRDKNLDFWLSNEEIYHEPRILPLSYLNVYVKGRYFEILKSPSLNLSLNLSGYLIKKEPLLKRRCFPDVVFYELKFFDKNEFSHWTSGEASHTPRKRKEMESFEIMESGEVNAHSAYTRIDSASMDFLEHLTT